MPGGISKADIGKKMADRVDLRNYFDEYYLDLGWVKSRFWSQVTAVDRQAGVFEGNLMDFYWTQMEEVTKR